LCRARRFFLLQASPFLGRPLHCGGEEGACLELGRTEALSRRKPEQLGPIGKPQRAEPHIAAAAMGAMTFGAVAEPPNPVLRIEAAIVIFEPAPPLLFLGVDLLHCNPFVTCEVA
jgi:hypothetical protein